MKILTDFVTVSTPQGHGPDLREALSDICLQIPGSQTDPLGVRVNRFGLLRFSEMHGVAIASASGMLLAALRGANLLSDYVSAIASVVTYNVTHLDLAGDRETDCPSTLATYYALLRCSGVALSRKHIPPERVKAIFSRGPDGRDTGSIMLGNRATSRVSGIIYDRQQDARDKGKPDPGPVLRTEMRLGVPGMSLRDVVEPAPLFYHYAAPGLFARPDDVPAWAPYGEAFTMNRQVYDAQDKLRRLVERSTDLDRAVELVDQLPGEGLDVLLRLIRQRYKIHQKTLAFAAGHGAPCGSEQPPAATSGDVTDVFG